MDDTVLSAVAGQVDSQARTIDIQLEDGRVYCCSLVDASNRLRLVDPALLNDWEWIGPRVGIHWPTVDEDLSIEYLVAHGHLCDKRVFHAEPEVDRLRDLIRDIHALTDNLRWYERQYGILSETFYQAYLAGEGLDGWLTDDWEEWAEVYAMLLDRQEEYQSLTQTLREPSGSILDIIRRTGRRQPLPSPS